MALFRLVASLGLNTTQFDAGIKRATSMATRANSALAATAKGWLAGAFGVYAIQAAVRKAAEYASNIQDVSDTLGVGTTRVQQWSYAAAQTGASLDDFTRAFNKLQRDNPNLTLEQTLKLFDDISETIRSGALGPSGSAALAFEKFGRSGLRLLPAMSQGMSELSAQADRFGLIAGPEQIAAVDRLTDAIGALSQAISAKLAVAMANVTETSTDFFNGIAGILDAFKNGTIQFGAGSFLEAFQGGIVSAAIKSMASGQASAAAANLIIPESMQQAVEQQRFGMVSPEVTDRQRVGAYSGATPVFIQEQRKQTTYLQQINQNTFETKEAVTRKD